MNEAILNDYAFGLIFSATFIVNRDGPACR